MRLLAIAPTIALIAGAFEVDVLRVASRPLEAHDAVRDRDHAVRHRLHHHPVDVRDFVVAGVDGVQRPDAGGNVAVDVQPELVRLARCSPAATPG